MAQADEMGEGEGRDDGFIDGAMQEPFKRRSKKRTGKKLVAAEAGAGGWGWCRYIDINQKFGQLKLDVDKFFIFAQCTVLILYK